MEQFWSKILNRETDKYEDEDDLPLLEYVSRSAYYNDIIQQTAELLLTIARNASLDVENMAEWNEDVNQEDPGDAKPESEDSGCDEPEEHATESNI